MSIDTSEIGVVAAGVMEALGDETEGKIVAVGIVVVVDNGDEGTYTRIKTSSDRFYEQLGLFHAAIHVAESGIPYGNDEDDE